MSNRQSISYTAFSGQRMLHSGSPDVVALQVKRALERNVAGTILVFDDATGRVVDLDLRGTDDEVIARLSRPPQSYQGHYRPSTAEPQEEAPEARGRGRPKLGVLAREVTLLPRQWEWLAKQPSGASATLRRLVDNARRAGDQHRRERQEAAYHFMYAMGGDLPGYEEATRALFAGDAAGMEQRIATWPEDIRSYVLHLASAVEASDNDVLAAERRENPHPFPQIGPGVERA